MKTSSRSILRCLLPAVAFFFLIVRLGSEWRHAPEYAAIPSYKRVDWWLLSAACAQSRHAWLAVCTPDGRLIPIEDVSPTDDRGHTLAVDLLARVKKTPVDRTDLVRLNLILNVLGGASIAFLLFWGDLALSALGVLLATLWLFPTSVHIAGPDVPAAFLGLFGFAALPTLWLVIQEFRHELRLIDGVIGLKCAGALLLAIVMRQPIGLIGMVSLLYWTAFFAIKHYRQRERGRMRYILFAALAGFSFFAPRLLLSARNEWTSVPPGHLIASHGIAHAFYQGLGTETNPWGIHYEDDADGHEAVQKINPTAGYGTPQYYHEIGKLYVQLVIHHPETVFGIYARKLWKTLTLPLKILGVPYIWVIVMVGVAVALGQLRKRLSTLQLYAMAAWGGYLGLFLLQGVLITPEIRILYPAKFAVLVLLFLTVRGPDTADAV